MRDQVDRATLIGKPVVVKDGKFGIFCDIIVGDERRKSVGVVCDVDQANVPPNGLTVGVSMVLCPAQMLTGDRLATGFGLTVTKALVCVA